MAVLLQAEYNHLPNSLKDPFFIEFKHPAVNLPSHSVNIGTILKQVADIYGGAMTWFEYVEDQFRSKGIDLGEVVQEQGWACHLNILHDTQKASKHRWIDQKGKGALKGYYISKTGQEVVGLFISGLEV